MPQKTQSMVLLVNLNSQEADNMLYSDCCGAIVYDDYDICSECLEHCDVWEDTDEEEEC